MYVRMTLTYTFFNFYRQKKIGSRNVIKPRGGLYPSLQLGTPMQVTQCLEFKYVAFQKYRRRSLYSFVYVHTCQKYTVINILSDKNTVMTALWYHGVQVSFKYC